MPMLWDGPRHVRNTHGDTADALASAKAIEDMILAEGPETVALVIAEPVQNGRAACAAGRLLAGTPPHLRQIRRAAVC